MKERKVRKSLLDSLEKLKQEDSDLLRYNVNKRSITHQLAVYLREEIDDGWDVDVEYNRVGDNEASKVVSMKCLESKIPDNKDPKDLDAKTVYPDVVVHSRGEPNKNLLVIEAKKSGRSGEYDREKLTAYKQELKYEYGVFVTFKGCRSNEDPGYCCDWYPFEDESNSIE